MKPKKKVRGICACDRCERCAKTTAECACERCACCGKLAPVTAPAPIWITPYVQPVPWVTPYWWTGTISSGTTLTVSDQAPSTTTHVYLSAGN